MSSLDVKSTTLRMNHQKRQPMSHAQRARLDRAFVEQLDRQGSVPWNSVDFHPSSGHSVLQWQDRLGAWFASGGPSRKTYRSSDWSYTIDKLVEGAVASLWRFLRKESEENIGLVDSFQLSWKSVKWKQCYRSFTDVPPSLKLVSRLACWGSTTFSVPSGEKHRRHRSLRRSCLSRQQMCPKSRRGVFRWNWNPMDSAFRVP